MLRVTGTDRYACMSGCAELDLRPSAPPSEMKLPGLDRGRQSTKVKMGEKELQRQIVGGLKGRGYIVLETSEARIKVQCPPMEGGCGKWFTPHVGRAGLSRGLPDIFVRNPRWPPWAWIGLELKGSNTASREEQIRMAQDGHLRVCWSWEDVAAAVAQMDRELLGES